MTKVNDHINFRLQQLEEKQSNSSANNESINAIPSQASPITESVATRVNDEYRDRENCKLNIIVHQVPESVATESAARIAHDTKYVTDIVNTIDTGPLKF